MSSIVRSSKTRSQEPPSCCAQMPYWGSFSALEAPLSPHEEPEHTMEKKSRVVIGRRVSVALAIAAILFLGFMAVLGALTLM